MRIIIAGAAASSLLFASGAASAAGSVIADSAIDLCIKSGGERAGFIAAAEQKGWTPIPTPEKFAAAGTAHAAYSNPSEPNAIAVFSAKLRPAKPDDVAAYNAFCMVLGVELPSSVDARLMNELGTARTTSDGRPLWLVSLSDDGRIQLEPGVQGEAPLRALTSTRMTFSVETRGNVDVASVNITIGGPAR